MQTDTVSVENTSFDKSCVSFSYEQPSNKR